MDSFLSPALRLLAALVAGGVVGANRDMYGKPTGVRMHALVALGAALLTLLGSELPDCSRAA
jgi:putative Mg2+ transporter-C (MgtC) family protein